VRDEDSLREVKINFGGRELNVVVIPGLRIARKILKDIKVDRSRYDFVEVMACHGGCIRGIAEQPV
jgi:NADH-quinone oxidoreductase subunit G